MEEHAFNSELFWLYRGKVVIKSSQCFTTSKLEEIFPLKLEKLKCFHLNCMAFFYIFLRRLTYIFFKICNNICFSVVIPTRIVYVSRSTVFFLSLQSLWKSFSSSNTTFNLRMFGFQISQVWGARKSISVMFKYSL